MKRLLSILLIVCVVPLLTMAADNIIKNPLMAQQAANGQPIGWSIHKGFAQPAEDGFVATASTIAVQQITLPMDTDVRLVYSVTAPEGFKYRVYAEYWTDKKADGTGAKWRNSGADWLTGTGKKQEIVKIFKVEFPYDHAHFAVCTDKGEGAVTIHKLELEPYKRPVIENADFSQRDATGLPVDWRIRGTELTYGKDGADVTISAPEGKGGLIFKVLNPTPCIPVTVTFEAKSAGTWRSYVEWYEGEKYDRTEANWKAGVNKWVNTKLIFCTNGPSRNCILVFATQNGVPLSIRNLQVKEAKDAAALGGYWIVPEPHILKDCKIDVFGMKGAVTLHGIPVKAGQRYRISYVATGLDDARSLTGFHEITTNITPAVDGKFGFNDARNAPQRKYQTFTVPENFKARTINFALSIATPGTVRFSDFQLEEIPVDPTEKWSLVVESPFYRNTIFASDKPSDIRLTVNADGLAANATARLAMPDGTVRDAKSTFKDGEAKLTLPPWSGTDGKAKLEVTVQDANGKTLRTFTETLQKVPSQKREIKVHPNGYFTCNGEWLFPIVPFDLCCADTLQEIYTYARNGFTLIRHNYNGVPQNGIKVLDMAQKCGIKLCFYIGFPKKLADLPFYKQRLYKAYPKEILEHPAFFGYFIADEPLWGGVPYNIFQEVYAIHQEFDPYHPTWINAAPRNEVSDLKPYGASCDIYGVDIYPVPWPNNHSGLDDKTPTSCGKYALRMLETVNGRKPIINWLQGFSWHEFADDRWKPANPKPYPTLMQSRFMVYDTLLNGGTGYGIYGIRYALHNEFIEEILQVAREANGMSRLFVLGKRLPDLKTTTPAIRVAAIEFEGKKYFFILNLTDKPASGSIDDGEKVPKGLRDYVSGTAVDFGKLELGPYGVLTCGPKLPPSINPIPPAIPELEAKGSPFPTKIRSQYEEDMLESYKGDGIWIWDEASHFSGGHCLVYKAIEVADTKKDAFALITADDAFELYVNGKQVAKSSGWSYMVKVDLKPYLVKGTNHVVVHGFDAGGLPCGVLAEIHADGKTVATNTSWLSTPWKADFKELPSPEKLAKGSPAKVITPYGGGAWGKKVKIHEYAPEKEQK